MNAGFTGYAGRAAYLAGITGIVGFVSLVLFFAIEAPQAAAGSRHFYFWGLLSDISGPLAMLPLLVVVLALHRLERSHAPALSRIASAIGAAGALGVTILQVLLIFKFLSFEQEVGPVVIANGVVGVWLLLANHLGRVQGILSPALAWLGIVVGIAEALYPVVFQITGGSDFYTNAGSNLPLLILGSLIFLVSYVGFPLWALWLGRVFSARDRVAVLTVDTAFNS